MPRKGRGGKRTGEMGGQYSNRSDLAMNAGTATHMPENVQPYGTTTPASELPQGAGPGGPQGAPAAPEPNIPLPGSLTSLDAPTERPDESIMAGLDSPRAGSGIGRDRDELLRALYQVFPHDDIRELLAMRGLE